MKSQHYTKILMPLLVILLIALTIFFIAIYCDIFDEFGAIAKRRLIEYPIITFFVTPLFFWVSAFLCRKFSPNAAGHNLQTAIEVLKENPNNFSKISPYMNFRLVLVKALSSAFSTFGGGSLGKEGPSVHMSAAIFTIFANRYKKFLEKIDLEAWLFAGCALGLTIAFNAPIAGVVFASEKLSKFGFKTFRKNIFWVLIIIAITTLLFARQSPFFNFNEVAFSLESGMLKALILTTLICGFVAVIVKRASYYFLFKISGIESNYWHLIPITAGFVVAYINFYSGIYSFSGGIWTIQQTLNSDFALLSYREVGARIVNTIITFASGSAGGLIAPAMAIGTGIGSVMSSLLGNADLGAYLLFGMVAFLSVIVGEPIAAAVIVFETTGQNITALPFLLAASFIAFGILKGIARVNAPKDLSEII
jgi:H+/Cl- antiporter ClcA